MTGRSEDWEGQGGDGTATPGKRAVSSGRGSRCARVCTTSTIVESLLDFFLSLFPSFLVSGAPFCILLCIIIIDSLFWLSY